MAIIAVLVKFETNLKMYIKVTRYLLQVHVQFIEITMAFEQHTNLSISILIFY